MGKSNDPRQSFEHRYICYYSFICGLDFYRFFDIQLWLRSIWGATIVGLAVGVVVVALRRITLRMTRKSLCSMWRKASQTGPAFTILSGISYGFMSALFRHSSASAFQLQAAYFLCYPLGGGDAELCVQYAMFRHLHGGSRHAFHRRYDRFQRRHTDLSWITPAALAEMGRPWWRRHQNYRRTRLCGQYRKKPSPKALRSARQALRLSHCSPHSRKSFVWTQANSLNFDIMNPLVFFGLLVGLGIPALFLRYADYGA